MTNTKSWEIAVVVLILFVTGALILLVQEIWL